MAHKISIKVLVSILISLFAILGFCTRSFATDPEVAAQEIYHSIMSPYCPGRLLSDCPSGAATELKQQIRQDLISGKSKAVVIDGLYAKYGEGKLKALPDTRGWGLVGWIIPSVFLFGGVLIIVWWLKTSSESENIYYKVPDIEKELEDRIRNDMR